MKKILIFAAVLFLVGLLAAGVFSSDMAVNIDGNDIGGPAGVVVAGLAGGFGILIAAFVLLVVGGLLFFVFVGSTLLVAICLGLVAALLALVAFPFCLPLLLPALIIWGLVKLIRRAQSPSVRVEPKSLPLA